MKIRFQRIVAFIGIVIAFLNCGIIYNIYAKENTSDDKNIVIANTYMKELTNITSEEHDEVTVKSYEIDKAFYVYLFDDVNLFSVSSKINKNKCAKQLYVPYKSQDKKAGYIIFDITSEGIEYNKTLYDCTKFIEFVNSSNEIYRKIKDNSSLNYFEYTNNNLYICSIESNYKNYIIPFLKTEINEGLVSNKLYTVSEFEKMVNNNYGKSEVVKGFKIDDENKIKNMLFGGSNKSNDENKSDIYSTFILIFMSFIATTLI